MNKEQFDNLRELMDDYADMLKVRDNMLKSLSDSNQHMYDPWLTDMFFTSASDYEPTLILMRHAALEVVEKDIAALRDQLAELGVALEEGDDE